ncbi:MAG TPA: PQQ-dependent sugar dehydrogenase [Gemmatimonadales bacterium]|jgi:hypothetical protein
MTAGKLTIIGAAVAIAALAVGLREHGLTRPGPLSLRQSRRDTGLKLTTAFSDLGTPVYLTAPAGDPRIFIVLQDGKVMVARDGHVQPRPWLDITARVKSGGEQGLLSIAFHPGFATNGRFFASYTDRHGDTRVTEFHADPAAEHADSASERQLVFVRQPWPNHNGGHILFGPDGRLYVGMGDGGAEDDPRGYSQNPRSQLGKMLRVDVDGSGPVVIQSWALGLRNPWRFWFDAGLLYIADVGQNTWEEIDVAPARDSGLNYGWRTMEGAHCFLNPICGHTGLVLPAVEYDHDQGCSVIGGAVYRGHAIPQLDGLYLYSDYCGGWLRSFRYANGAATENRTWSVPKVSGVASFGVDGSGEVYIVSHFGTIYRIDRTE